ncbi:MAG: hypothetical protein BWY76_03398 [bacterium ADurb.Bin429]|nr:MAG: hypothetical protein BWY76_03398 [bacterium ADurb.Bin429]
MSIPCCPRGRNSPSSSIKIQEARYESRVNPAEYSPLLHRSAASGHYQRAGKSDHPHAESGPALRGRHRFHQRVYAVTGVRVGAVRHALWPLPVAVRMLRERLPDAVRRAAVVHGYPYRGRISHAWHRQVPLHPRPLRAARFPDAGVPGGAGRRPGPGRLPEVPARERFSAHLRPARHSRRDVLRAAAGTDAGVAAPHAVGGRPRRRLRRGAGGIRSALAALRQLHPPAPALRAAQSVAQALPRADDAAALHAAGCRVAADLGEPRAEPLQIPRPGAGSEPAALHEGVLLRGDLLH